MTTTQARTNGTEVVSWNPWPEIFPAAVRFSELLQVHLPKAGAAKATRIAIT